MASVQIYLTFNGNCEDAFNFYKSVFGGEFTYIGRFKDMPSGEDGNKMLAEEENRIMHVALPIGHGTHIFGSDTGGEWSQGYSQGNNFSISINADTKEEADRIFNALAEGGQVTMPMNTTFWAEYFGMLTDKFGINWMMSFKEGQA